MLDKVLVLLLITLLQRYKVVLVEVMQFKISHNLLIYQEIIANIQYLKDKIFLKPIQGKCLEIHKHQIQIKIYKDTIMKILLIHSSKARIKWV